MPSPSAVPPWPQPDPDGISLEAERGKINQNIEAVRNFYSREDPKISRSQRLLERISQVIGTPACPGFILVFVLLRVSANAALIRLGWGALEPAPVDHLHTN